MLYLIKISNNLFHTFLLVNLFECDLVVQLQYTFHEKLLQFHKFFYLIFNSEILVDSLRVRDKSSANAGALKFSRRCEVDTVSIMQY